MELSRRNFLKGAGVVGVATAAAALTGCNQPASMAATGTTNAENDATAEDWLGSANCSYTISTFHPKQGNVQLLSAFDI